MESETSEEDKRCPALEWKSWSKAKAVRGSWRGLDGEG